MNKEIEAILIDVDGCVVPTNRKVSCEFFSGLSTIARYVGKANQGKFPSIAFCSGRDRNYIEAVSYFVGLPDFWSVIESGVALFNPATKELLFNPVLTDEVEKTFQKITEKRVPEILERYPELFLYPGNMVCVALERKYGAKLTIENAYSGVTEEMEDLLQSGRIRITHSDCAVDIGPTGIDKASGIKFLSQHTGINLEKTLGIGDSNGDVPLFKSVGLVGCPANASEECKKLVKKRKGYISSYFYARGVADVIENFVK